MCRPPSTGPQLLKHDSDRFTSTNNGPIKLVGLSVPPPAKVELWSHLDDNDVVNVIVLLHANVEEELHVVFLPQVLKVDM